MAHPMRTRRSGGDVRRDRLDRRAVGYERDGLGSLLLRLQLDAVAALGLTSRDRFLDVGCATGAAVRVAAATARLAVGVDRSAVMIGQAQRRAIAHPGAGFVLAEAGRLPFGAGAFTAVLCTSVLHDVDDPLGALGEMTRVVGAAGRLVVGDFVHESGRVWRPDSEGWSGRGCAVTRSWRTLTPFGFYVFVVAGRGAQGLSAR